MHAPADSYIFAGRKIVCQPCADIVHCCSLFLIFDVVSVMRQSRQQYKCSPESQRVHVVSIDQCD